MKLLAGVPLKRIGYSPLPVAGRQLVLTVAPATGWPAMTPLHVQVLDSTLRLVSQRTVQLRGKCTLLDTSLLRSKEVTAFQFKQHNPGADSVLLKAAVERRRNGCQLSRTTKIHALGPYSAS